MSFHRWQTNSSSISSSSSSSPCYVTNTDDNFIKHRNETNRASKLISLFSDPRANNSYGYIQRRHLTRARKLSHLTDNDIGHAPARFMVKPVPLPLPELEVLFHEPVYHGDSNGFQRMASADRLRYIEHTESQNGRVFLRSGHMHTCSFSAPTSPVSSPVFNSPRSADEMFTPYHLPPPTLHMWSEPEPSYLDMNVCAIGSPVHNPCQRTGVKSSMRSHSRLHRNIFAESSMGRHDSNAHNTLATAHLLPLPPGATMPLSFSPTKINSRHDMMLMTPRQSQWKKGKLIGRGTFGSVYVGYNRETGALCAMKEVELLPDDPKCVECIKQLEQEIDVLSQLKHPNIVQYYGSEVVDDRFYIYLEYVHPGSINRYVRDHRGGMAEPIVRNFTRHIVSGLAYLHSTRTIHRDIKGANLLVDVNGVVKLADFGMAKPLNEQVGQLSLKGSPYWMAPELLQLESEKDANPDLALAVDIWSLGCTIIEMIDGKPPWSEYEGPAAMFRVMKENPPIPEKTSSEGKDFLNCCFIRNPAERPTARMLLEHSFLKNSSESHVPYILMDKELLHREPDRLLVPTS